MLRTALAAAVMLAAGTALADEVIIHRDTPPPETSRTVTETHGDAGCSSKTVHKENDMGDSKTVTKSDC